MIQKSKYLVSEPSEHGARLLALAEKKMRTQAGILTARKHFENLWETNRSVLSERSFSNSARPVLRALGTRTHVSFDRDSRGKISDPMASFVEPFRTEL
jgi:hypothetical protein